MKESELIELDFDGLSDTDIAVLLMMDEGHPVSRTRLQKTAFLYDRLYEPGKWFEEEKE